MTGAPLTRLAWLRLGALALLLQTGAGPAVAQEPTVPLPPEPETLAVISELRPAGRGNYVGIVWREAARHGLPAEIADAVVRVESGYDPSAVGSVGEVGLMQVRPSTAAMLGFAGPVSDLFDPATNIRLGVAYLAGAWRLAGGDLCTTLAKYRAGHGATKISARSAAYCARASTIIAGGATRGESQVARVASAKSPGSARDVARAAAIRGLVAQHAARVRQIEARISRVMGGSS